ncbi:MAG: polyprenyl synthetase family protein [Bacteroidales bacterium]|nr:polyprenyl synthetase family protein [Bacteroidales bacterium]
MFSLQDLQDKVNLLIANQEFKKTPPKLYDPIAYTMNQGGKRIRPLLTLIACDLFGGDIDKALYPALALEVFHNFTLVHDDIMDIAPLRRGRETVYKRWNSNIAILSGDTMFALAYQFALQTDHKLVPKILEVFSKAAIEVCEGQQLDMDFESIPTVNIEDYLEMIRLKTAVLIAVSLQIGAIVANASEKEIEAIYNFGTHLGMAFQLMDDLLDVYGEQEQFGKKTGGDIASNKKTYLFLKALELCNKDERKLLNDLYNDSGIDPDLKISKVKLIFDQTGVKADVELLMQDYYDKAMDCLDSIQVQEDRKSQLLILSALMLKRNY